MSDDHRNLPWVEDRIPPGYPTPKEINAIAWLAFIVGMIVGAILMRVWIWLWR